MSKIDSDSQIPIILLGISIFLAVTLVVWFYNDAVYKPLVIGSGLYAFLGVICLGFWMNREMQPFLFGIEKSSKTFLWILIGVINGVVILSLSYFGLSIGTPMLPASIATNFRWVVVNVFAPVFEDSLRFALFGFVLYLTRRCSKSLCGIDRKYIWMGIIIQALFFTGLHFAAYKIGFYEAPTFMEGILGLSAVSSSLIAAFIFAFTTGFFVSRDGIRNYALAMAAHLTINSWLFAKMSIVGLSILPNLIGVLT